jgi:hypothetical protein
MSRGAPVTARGLGVPMLTDDQPGRGGHCVPDPHGAHLLPATPRGGRPTRPLRVGRRASGPVAAVADRQRPSDLHLSSRRAGDPRGSGCHRSSRVDGSCSERRMGPRRILRHRRRHERDISEHEGAAYGFRRVSPQRSLRDRCARALSDGASTALLRAARTRRGWPTVALESRGRAAAAKTTQAPRGRPLARAQRRR